MHRILSFLTKRSDLSTEAFRDYYESKHIPLILSLAPAPAIYKRRYIDRNNNFTDSGTVVDFDVTTELAFADQETFLAWIGKLTAPENENKVAIDEAMFLDRSRTRAYVIDERVTVG